MEVTYEFQEAAEGTLVRIRFQGDASGFYKLAGPLMSRAAKRNITNDLAALKLLPESGADGP
jgi:hypothetical protein